MTIEVPLYIPSAVIITITDIMYNNESWNDVWAEGVVWACCSKYHLESPKGNGSA